MPSGTPLSDAVRAEVMAAVMAGMSISEAARKYRLSKSVVARIRESIGDAKRTERTKNEKEEKNESGESFDVLLAQGLRAHIRFQTSVLTVCSHEEYLRSQTASDIARLLEVSQSYSIRLLEAASRGDEGDDAEA